MKTFVVGYIDWSENELYLERIDAKDWQHAVARHSKYPWKDDEDHKPSKVAENFKQECFDCDCMMNWIEI